MRRARFPCSGCRYRFEMPLSGFVKLPTDLRERLAIYSLTRVAMDSDDLLCFVSSGGVVTIPAQGKRERNRQRWFERIRAWELSGLSQHAFIEQHGVNAESFHRWKRIYRSEGGGVDTAREPSGMPARASAGLVPVKILQQPSAGDSGVMLEFDGARRIRLEPAFDAGTLEPVLQLLANQGDWR